MTYGKKTENIIKKIENEFGYHFDRLESYAGCFRFTFTGCVMPIIFESYSDMLEWYNGVVRD